MPDTALVVMARYRPDLVRFAQLLRTDSALALVTSPIWRR